MKQNDTASFSSTSAQTNDRLVTCLATYRTLNTVIPATIHHCRIDTLHVIHYCPCGIAWLDE
jgi:hypothetical protein